MHYHVFRKTKSGAFVQTAQTEMLPDAKKILGQYHSGYIAYFGEFIVEKNMDA